MEEIKSVKDARDVLMSKLLNKAGEGVVEDFIRDLKEASVFKDPKYYSRLKKELQGIATKSDFTEDDDLIKGTIKGNRLLKNFDYASEGLFMFAYKDGLKRLNKPFPMIDAFSQVFDNGYGKTNLGAIKNRLPLYPSVNTIYEVITDENIGEEE